MATMKPKLDSLGAGLGDIGKAISLHRAGKLEPARRIYQGILTTHPNHVEALHFLGVLLHQSGQSDQAIISIERAIVLAPDYADAHNNLGNIFRETNQFEAAFRAYQRVVELVPGHADGWNNLGVLLRGRGEYEEADKAYLRAIELNPAHVAARQNRGSLLARLHRFDEAVAAYKHVLELRPRNTAAYDALSRTLYRAGRIDEAIAIYHEWLNSDPGNSVALHMLAACTGEAAPARASNSYVRDTFDAFAGSFDQVLDQLGYRAPALIGEWLEQAMAAADGTLVVADAGCGTGLCADFLRPRARQLVGVDLSAGMLARARARNQYDQLVEAELSAWLASQPPNYDLIVSADTLCYFGALEEVLSGAARALRPGGRLVFTVESADGAEAYQLNPTGRYSHAEGYVRDVLAKAMLEVIAIGKAVLRRERGSEVGGYLVSARRAGRSHTSAEHDPLVRRA
jgi:predicted TPR repeat methyltransferase